MHVLGASVLEADDVENLLEKFEATEENNQLLRSGSSSDELATLDFSPATRDPHKRSQIIAAVENHFSINSSSSSSRVPIKSESASTPRIGKQEAVFCSRFFLSLNPRV